MKATTIACSLLLGVLVGCSSGPGPDADKNKTAAELKQEVAELETATIQTTVDAYETSLSALTEERQVIEKSVGDFASKVAEKGLGALTGDKDAADELSGDADALKEQLDELGDELTNLESKLKIYVDELASRADG